MQLAGGARRGRGWLTLLLVVIAAGAVVLLRREANGPPRRQAEPAAAPSAAETERPEPAPEAPVAEPKADPAAPEPAAPTTVKAEKHPVKVKAAASKAVVGPGERFEIGLEVQVAEGWHINSHQPLDDFLVPTMVEVRGGIPVEAEEVKYPPGETLTLGGDRMSVYQGTVKLAVPLKVKAEAGAGEGAVRVGLRFQACDGRVCLAPEEVEVAVPVEVGGPGRG